MRLLLIEDDLKLAQHLTDSLLQQGYAVTTLSDKPTITEALVSPMVPDIVIMDRIINNYDTKNLVPQVRQQWPQAPILVLSAISTPNERTELLNLGADDYVGKPFSTQELIARIKVLLRRANIGNSSYLQVGNTMIDLIGHLVSVEHTSINLPAKEFALLRTLATNPSRIWSKDDLLDYVWGQNQDVETNVVESTIANVRKKLAQIGATASIRNLRNAGYWITA